MSEGARRVTGSGAAGQTFGFGAGAQPGLWGLAYQFGGDFFTKEHYANGLARTSNIGSPEVLAAMTARADLMNKTRVWPTQADFAAVGINGLTPLFIAGRLGMLMDTGSEWPRIDKESRFEWGVAAVPRQKDNKMVNFINPLMLSKDSKNKEAAWAFMKWNVGEPGQRLLVQNSFQPVHKALLDEWLKGGSFKQTAAEVKKAVEGAAPHSQISPNQLFVEFGLVRTAVDEAMAAHLERRALGRGRAAGDEDERGLDPGGVVPPLRGKVEASSSSVGGPPAASAGPASGGTAPETA